MRLAVLWRVGVLLCLCLLVACRGSDAPDESEAAAVQPLKPMVLDYNFGDAPLTLDPAFASNPTSQRLVAQLFEGLTTFDPASAEPRPALATAWDISGDGLTYTFRMRQDAFWVNRDGEPQRPVTAEDVAFAIKRVCHPDTNAPMKAILFILKGCEEVNLTEGIPDIDSVGVRAVESYTVEFTLDEPAAYLPAILGIPIAWPVPSDEVEQFGEAWSTPEHLLTDGPYLPTSLVPGGSLVLDKNPSYYDAASVAIVRVQGRSLAAADALDLYRAGGLDSVDVPTEQIARTLADPTLATQRARVPESCSLGYGFTTIKPPLDNPRVRRALSYAIDREWLADNVFARGQLPSYHFLPPSVFGTPPRGTVGIVSDAARAQRLMAEAGYPNGQGFPSITLLYPSGEEQARLAAAVSEMWRVTLNLTVELREEPRDLYLRTIKSTTPLEEVPHVWVLGWCGHYPDAHDWLYALFHVEQAGVVGQARPETDERVTVQLGMNHVRRAPGDLDELLEQAARNPDPDQRRELYAQVEQLLTVDEAIYAPIFYESTTVLTQPWLSRTFFAPTPLSFKGWQIDMAAKEPLSPAATRSPTP